ncbi:MAG: hypothetical protein IJD38_00510 [Clostridia bacterium]|nr:hypothetical protein [Clostridia bacterium]
MEILDFHAHILPRVDHGSKGVEDGIRQLAMMQAVGVETVCATSHFYPQMLLPSEYVKERDASLKNLLRAWGDAPRPHIIPGAEVLICLGMEEMEDLERLCMEGTNVLLLEMPLTERGWDPCLLHTAQGIARRGIHPVLAHVDRYPPPSVEMLLDMGFTGQINARSLTGLLQPKQLLRWIGQGSIVALGSDLHGCDPNGYSSFARLLKFRPRLCETVMKGTAMLLRNAKRY